MKVLKVFLGVIVTVGIVFVFILGYFGFVPGLSDIFGSNKPRDLGIHWTETDRISGRAKTGVVYETLPADTAVQDGIQTSGSRSVTTELSAEEMTAIFNNKPVKFWPFKDVQLKFNSDGSGEISGVIIKNRIPDYATYIGAPKDIVDMVMNFLPSDPVFYVKGIATLENNEVGLFEPQKFEIGRVSLPISVFLSLVPPEFIKTSYAMDNSAFNNELSGVSDKRTLIINFINERLTHYPGFYAETAKFEEDKLIFNGTLPTSEASVQ